jgi:uncharacterized membrane protein YdbT with pleckstrin-like domain
MQHSETDREDSSCYNEGIFIIHSNSIMVTLHTALCMALLIWFINMLFFYSIQTSQVTTELLIQNGQLVNDKKETMRSLTI